MDLSRDFLLGGPIALTCAIGTYRWIENPIRRSTRARAIGAKRTVAYAAMSAGLFILVALALGAWAKYSPRSPFEARMLAAQRDTPPLRPLCHGSLGDAPRLAPLDLCLEPPGSPRIDVVLWGDSAADHWRPALIEASRVGGFSNYQLTRDVCPPLLGFEVNCPDPTQRRKCEKFQQLSILELARLRAERGLKAVVLSASWSALAPAPLEATLEATLDRLEELGVKVLIIGPTPLLRFRAPECLLRHDEAFCALSRADFERQSQPAMNILSRVAGARLNVKVLDPEPYFCDDARCPASRNGVILFTDDGHISASAARGFASFARADLEWLR